MGKHILCELIKFYLQSYELSVKKYAPVSFSKINDVHHLYLATTYRNTILNMQNTWTD